MPRRKPIQPRPAFSLVELVMVVTIIGIIAAIAVPRITGGSSRAAGSALEATLTNVRKAIDCYYAEHDRYPGYDPASGAPDDDQFVNQLTLYTDANGASHATPAYPYVYGPYLRAPFPLNPANNLRTVFVKKDAADADPADGAYGWVAVLSDGDFGVSASDPELVRVGVVEVQSMRAVRLQSP